MSDSLELFWNAVQELLQGAGPVTGDSYYPHLYVLILSQLDSSRRLLRVLHKQAILDWHGPIYDELLRVVKRITTLWGHSEDIPISARGEYFLEALLDLRWWTWVITLQADTLVANPTLYHVYFQPFEGVFVAKFSLSGDSITRRLPSYCFELWQQETQGRLRDLLSEGNKILDDQGDDEASLLLTEIKKADRPVFEVKHLQPTVVLDAGKPNSIQDYLVIDLTQDLLGASSAGYVIRATCADEHGGSYSCALKRINTTDEKPPDLARLRHPHVVHLKHYWIEEVARHDEVNGGECTFLTFLVMELMHGDLAKLMTRTKAPFALPVAVDVMLQIAKGMLYLHEMGVSHPHLKCENVLCRIENKPTHALRVGDVLVKLGGFGCSRPANVDTRKRDVLCFGLTCLEILTGAEGIHGADRAPRPSIPEATPPILKRCIASCLDTELTFSEVVMLLLVAQCQIIQFCKDGIVLSSESLCIARTQTESQELASLSRSKDDLRELHPQLGEFPTSVKNTLIFFHGFPKFPEEWRMTWMTRDNKLLWPQKWLPEDIGEDIRVLSVSFDDHLDMSSDRLQLELSKQLLQKLVLRTLKLGEPKHAIILVGHSFGGVIMKALVTEAESFAKRLVQNSTDSQEVMECKNFLKSLASVVFYSVPHAFSSSEFENYISGCSNTRVLQRSSLLKSLRGDDRFILEMIRLSRDFESAVEPYGTKLIAFLEGKPMNKGRDDVLAFRNNCSNRMVQLPAQKCFLVTEKSCQSPSWERHKVDKDNHFEVCRPDSKSHIGYKILLHHLKQHLNRFQEVIETSTYTANQPRSLNVHNPELQGPKPETVMDPFLRAKMVLDYLSQLIELDPNNANYFLLRGATRKLLRDFRGASRDLHQANLLRPNDPETLLLRADFFFLMDDYQSALNESTRANEIKPNDASILKLRGTVKYMLSDFAGAVSDLDRADELCPNDADILKYRGAAVTMMGGYEGALNDLNRAYALNKKDARILEMRAEVRKLLSDYPGALRDLNRAVILKPNDGYILGFRGEVKFLMADYDGALDDFNRAAELIPDDALILKERCEVKKKLCDFEGALKDVNLACELNPNEVSILLLRGEVKCLLDDTEGALADLTLVTELVSDDSTQKWRGELKRKMDDFEGVVNGAHEVKPKDAVVLLLRGALKYLMGDDEGALVDLKCANELKPNDSCIKDWLLDVEKRLNEFKVLNEYLTTPPDMKPNSPVQKKIGLTPDRLEQLLVEVKRAEECAGPG